MIPFSDAKQFNSNNENQLPLCKRNKTVTWSTRSNNGTVFRPAISLVQLGSVRISSARKEMNQNNENRRFL